MNSRRSAFGIVSGSISEMRSILLIAAFALCLAFTVAAPLAAYTVTLAAFGLPHVLSEMRYVDRRFSHRLPPRRLVAIIVLLALVALARSLTVFHFVPVNSGITLELGLVALLALGVAGGSASRRLLSVALALTIGAAAALAPFDTAITFSVLHNLTPLAFLIEILPPDIRRSRLLLATFLLIGVPLLIASGVPREALSVIGVAGAGFNPLDAAGLGRQLAVYVPSPFAGSSHAVDFFTASVFAQQMHYLSVIVVLPALLGHYDVAARGILKWPNGWQLVVVFGAIGLALFGAFVVDFAQARAFYGIFASIHAWAEIPVLILALDLRRQTVTSHPASTDAEFATNETSIA